LNFAQTVAFIIGFVTFLTFFILAMIGLTYLGSKQRQEEVHTNSTQLTIGIGVLLIISVVVALATLAVMETLQ
jgi:NADH:ubiquinone oxidoreductase subunit 5 (subunit L)/multisubunit Na+/H+ antiporter MnhA subunit